MGLKELYKTHYTKEIIKAEKRAEKKALEKGREIGFERAAIESVKRGYENGLDLKTISIITSLSQTEIKKIIKSFQTK
jgi:predicted transposase/invertase (TIGR01784 family)